MDQQELPSLLSLIHFLHIQYKLFLKFVQISSKFDAVNFVKVGSEIIGGKGGGGRKDFAQAGGQDYTKIDEAFKSIKKLI